MILGLDDVILRSEIFYPILATSCSSSESMVRFLFFFLTKESKREVCLMAPNKYIYQIRTIQHTYNLNNTSY